MSALIFYPGILHPVVSPINDGINSVSTTKPVVWNTLSRLSPQQSVAWKIIAYGISASIEIQWDTEQRIDKVGAFISYGIDRPIVYPIDIKSLIPQIAWNISNRKSVIKSISWEITQRRASHKSVKWDVYNYEFANTTTSWNVLNRVYKPGVTVGRWINQLVEPIVKPITTANTSVNPSIQWKLNQRLPVFEPVKFNVRNARVVQKTINWNTQAIAVTKQVATAWITKKKIDPQVATSWHLNTRYFLKKPIAWHDNASVVIHKAVQWRITNHVTIQESIKWNTNGFIAKQFSMRWRIHSLVKAKAVTQWRVLFRIILKQWSLVSNSPGNISSGIVHPIDIGNPASQPKSVKGLSEPIVQPIDNSYYSSYGQTPQPGIQWRVGVLSVTAIQQTQWDILIRVNSKKETTWALSKRLMLQYRTWFNVYNSVVNRVTMEWNIGMGVSSHIRQTSQVRTDFTY